MLARQAQAGESRSFLLYVLIQTPREVEPALSKVQLPALRFGFKACVFLPQKSGLDQSRFTHLRPSRKSLTGMPSISVLQFFTDVVNLITRNSRHTLPLGLGNFESGLSQTHLPHRINLSPQSLMIDLSVQPQVRGIFDCLFLLSTTKQLLRLSLLAITLGKQRID